MKTALASKSFLSLKLECCNLKEKSKSEPSGIEMKRSQLEEEKYRRKSVETRIFKFPICQHHCSQLLSSMILCQPKRTAHCCPDRLDSVVILVTDCQNEASLSHNLLDKHNNHYELCLCK